MVNCILFTWGGAFSGCCDGTGAAGETLPLEGAETCGNWPCERWNAEFNSSLESRTSAAYPPSRARSNSFSLESNEAALAAATWGGTWTKRAGGTGFLSMTITTMIKIARNVQRIVLNQGKPDFCLAGAVAMRGIVSWKEPNQNTHSSEPVRLTCS